MAASVLGHRRKKCVCARVDPCDAARTMLESPRNTRSQVAIPSSPTGASKVVVYPAGPTQNSSRPEERRGVARHRTPSLMYIQIGPENGGIVVNLGTTGLAFQAAMKLSVEKNAVLNLKLRGSGLNTELSGELVWQGATGKEAGICFRNVSAQAEQEIAEWVERQTQACGTPAQEEGPQSKAMSAMPGISATGERSAARPLSAALAMSRALPADPAADANADLRETIGPAPTDFTAALASPAPAPAPEIFSRIEHDAIPSVDLDDRAEDRDAGRVAWREGEPVEAPTIDQTPQEQPHFASPDFEPPRKTPAESVRPIDSPAIESKAIPEELPRELSGSPMKSEGIKTEEVAQSLESRISGSLDTLLLATAAEKWIPPALLAAWRRGNRQRRMLLAGTAGACFLAFGMVLALAVAGMKGRLGHSGGGASLQQSTAPVEASSAGFAPPQVAIPQAPPAADETPRPKPHRQSTSLLESLTASFLGNDSDARIEIDDDQIGVRVWTSKRSGYFYCADSPFYRTLRPGSFMTQGDALQSGYQPRREHFCD